jgi:hypothetical protein
MNSSEALAVGAACVVVGSELHAFANAPVTLVHNGDEARLFNCASRLGDTARYRPRRGGGRELHALREGRAAGHVHRCAARGRRAGWRRHVRLRVRRAHAVRAQPRAVRRDDRHAAADAILEERRILDRAADDDEGHVHAAEEKVEYSEVFRKVANESAREEIRGVLAEHRAWIGGERDAPLNASGVAQRTEGRTQWRGKPRGRVPEARPAWQRLSASLGRVLETMNSTRPVAKPSLKINSDA